jgi:hypothetical protein
MLLLRITTYNRFMIASQALQPNGHTKGHAHEWNHALGATQVT